jgi:2-dehydro-3-deoxyglucarate aldolase
MKLQNYSKILNFRDKLKQKKATIGTWMQIPSSTVAEILGQAGFDWITIDMEHGTFSLHQLPDIFRAIELGNSLSLVRLANDDIKDCKQVLEAGASGFILPLIQNSIQLQNVVENTSWPPIGKRGIPFSRANLFGK